jgi:multiple sugar transport system permease protein
MAQSAVASDWPDRSRRALLGSLAYVVVLLGALFMLVPFLYMLSTSLKTLPDSFRYPPDWIPRTIVWQNYVEVWQRIPLATVYVNSIKVSALTVLGTLLSCTLGGYAFARLRFTGREFLFTVLLATLMVPHQVTLIPTFLLFRQLGLINSHVALWGPYWFGAAFGTFLMRQFYLTVPRDLEEAAKVDGCTPFGTFWRIFLPLGGPATATLAIFAFLGSWNNLLGPLIYLQDRELMTFPVALTWLGGQYYADLPMMMTAAILSIVPTLLIFLALQKYFVQGVVLSGLKA